MKAALLLLTLFPFAIASAQQVEVTASDRYFELSTLTLNEPCLTYNDVPYRAQFVLDDRAEDGLYWSIVSGEEISEVPDYCELVRPSVFTTDPTIPFISYDIENVIIADGNIDTGLRYSIASRADANHLELGFSFDWIRELREAESVRMNGIGSHSFSGPSSFPFEQERVAIYSLLTSHSFSGSFEYDTDTSIFTVELDSTNEAGSYQLTVVFRDFSRGISELQVVYPIEFTPATLSDLRDEFDDNFNRLQSVQSVPPEDICFDWAQNILRRHGEDALQLVPNKVIGLLRDLYVDILSRQTDLLTELALGNDNPATLSWALELANEGVPYFAAEGGSNFLMFSIEFDNFVYAESIRGLHSDFLPNLVVGVLQCEPIKNVQGYSMYVGAYLYLTLHEDQWRILLL